MEKMKTISILSMATALVSAKRAMLAASVAVIVAIFYTASESNTATDEVLFRKAGEYDLEYPQGKPLAVDVNSDGWIDILTTSGAGRKLFTFSVFLNNGDGTLTLDASYEILGTDVTNADFDGDGDVDLAVSTDFYYSRAEEATLTIFFNDGEGNFIERGRYPLKGNSTAILSGDLDGDGDSDIAVAQEEHMDLFFNDGEGSFPARGAIAPRMFTQLYYFLSGADFDGDGDLDLAYGEQTIGALGGYHSGFFVQFNQGQAIFADPVGYWNENVHSPVIMAEDFNGDGHTDICALVRSWIPGPYDPNPPEKIFVFLNHGDGVFGELIEILSGGSRNVSGLTTKADIKLLFGTTGDIDLDGSVDVVVTSGDYSSSGPIYPFLNRGDGTFVMCSGIPAGDHTWIPALADLDNDGDPDLMTIDMDWESFISTGEATPVLKVFLNTTIERHPTYVEDAEDEEKRPRIGGWSVLDQNVPNPFNAQTVITYDLARLEEVMLTIYDIQGRRVRILVREHQEPGRHSVVWDARDGEEKRCSNGVYYYVLETQGARHVKRMVLIK